MANKIGELVKFPVKLRANLAKISEDRKAPRHQSPDGYAFPQRLWEIYLDLSTLRSKQNEIVEITLPKHQLVMFAWLALSSKRRKANKPPLTDKEWFLMDDEYVMMVAKHAITHLVNVQYENEIKAIQNGDHPVLKP